MFNIFRCESRADRFAAKGDFSSALQELRKLGLDSFGRFLISLPNAKYPHLSKCLPEMASEQVQRDWTGDHGVTLLAQTNAFARLLADVTDLKTAKILDFGCGYGRILRAMYYYADPQQLYGCDPWDVSIKLCKEAGILGQLAQSDYLPDALPFDQTFDVIYAYSVFTHLSERATTSCLTTLAKHCTPDGVIAITIRPPVYWSKRADPRAAELLAKHESEGFAFDPHNREPVDGDIVYGDTTMTREWIAQRFPQLKIMDVRPTVDPLQSLVLLRLQS